MGMAASQARFLALTARKSNVEYEGQQINQQRTVLSNETANYYNDLLGMSVPVPPSAADYTKTVYSFEDGSLTNTISTMIAQSNGEYLISYTSNWIDDFAAVSAASSIVTRLTGEDNTQTSVSEEDITSSNIANLVKTDDGFYYNGIKLSATTFEDGDIPEQLTKAGMTAGTYYSYEEETPSGKVTHYIPQSQIEGDDKIVNYNADKQANVSNVISSDAGYFYGTNGLSTVLFDADENGIPAGRYYSYTADGETHYFAQEAVELQDVHRQYKFTYGDEELTSQVYDASNLPQREVNAIDIDGNELDKANTYYQYTDNEGETHYVKYDAANTDFITDGSGKVVSYKGKNEQTYSLTEVDLTAGIPQRKVVAQDINGKDLEAGKEYCAYTTKDSKGNDVTKYVLASEIINGTATGCAASAYYTYKDAQMEQYTEDDYKNGNIPDGYSVGDYHVGEHYFAAASVEGGEYLTVSDSKYQKALDIEHWIYDGKAELNNNSVPVDGYKYVQNYTYNVGAKTFRVLGSELNETELRDSDEYYKTLSDDQIEKLIAEENEYIAILNKQYGDDSEWMVRYVQNTSSNTWEPRFVKLNQLGNAIYSENESSLSYIPMYKVGSAQKNEEVKGVKARFEQDATGRIINVTLRPGEDDEVTYAVSTSTVTDQAKYDDAMNQYEYDKAKYDQAIQETNAKIEIIQAEDKNLELRLKQLDTEQDAISTEMDAVQKVIEKNTESTFKTFG